VGALDTWLPIYWFKIMLLMYAAVSSQCLENIQQCYGTCYQWPCWQHIL